MMIFMTTQWIKSTWLAFLSLILVFTAFTGCLDEDDEDEVDKVAIKTAAELVASILRTNITMDMVNLQTHVETLAGADELKAVLNDPNATNNQSANEHLESFNTLKETSVCYLMNATGITVASSNWNTGSSFVGKDYSFRPYFTEAMNDTTGEYFAVGVTTGVRGYYASFPVKHNDNVIGVAIIKQELDYFETQLEQHVLAFVVSPEGIIFLSSDDALKLMSLWPLSDPVKDGLTASRQLGDGPFAPVLDSVVSDGDEVVYNGKKYLVTITALNDQGWDIVLLSKI